MMELALYEAIPANFERGKTSYIHNDIAVTIHDNYPDELAIDLAMSMNHELSNHAVQIAQDFLETYLSETTNNDACEMDFHLKILRDPAEQRPVTVKAILKDWLT
jgi:hypothetical protein